MAGLHEAVEDADGVGEEERKRKVRLDGPGCVAASVRVTSKRGP